MTNTNTASVALAAQPQAAYERDSFQARVQPWLTECFGQAIASDRKERNHRFLEESLELVQACGCTAHEAHQLVDYVYGRPVGEPAQEAGGVMVTLAALCLANGLNMHAASEVELARVWTKVEAIRAKQASKPKHSPLPMRQPTQEPFGYFRLDPFGWTGCGPDDEGAIALYKHPAPQAEQAVPQNARDILERCREFIDTAPAYPAGADLADQIDALLAAPSAQDINEQRESTDNWRHLALQFDYHRMQAMSHLRNLLADSVGHREVAEAFVLAGPVSGTDIAHDAARYRALPQAARDVLAERQRQEGGGS